MNYLYRIGVIWKATEKGNYVPLFAAGSVDADGKWFSITDELHESEPAARVDVKLVTRAFMTPANDQTIDPERYDTRIFLDTNGKQ